MRLNTCLTCIDFVKCVFPHITSLNTCLTYIDFVIHILHTKNSIKGYTPRTSSKVLSTSCEVAIVLNGTSLIHLPFTYQY